MKIKTHNIVIWTALAFAICYFLRFLNFPNELTVILGGVICLALLIQQKKLRMDIGLCLLAVTLVSYYTIANGIHGIFYAILYIPLVIYVIAKYLICGWDESLKLEQKLLYLLMTMVIGFTILGLLNSYMWYAGYVVPGTRRWQDFWSGEIVPGTQHTAYFLPALAMFCPAVMYFKKRIVSNMIFILVPVFFCYTALVTKSRMQLVIFVLVCALQLLLFVLLEKEATKKILSNKITWIVFLIMGVACFAGILAVKDSKIVTDFIENMGKGGGILNNVRFEAQRMAVTQLFTYPMGGRLMELGRQYCHNTWLDMANASGVIPFFAFAGYTIYSAVCLVKFLLKNGISAEIKMMTLGLYVSFFLYMTVESVFDASIHLLTPWIWANAVIQGCLSKNVTE